MSYIAPNTLMSSFLGRNRNAAGNVFLTLPGAVVGSTNRGIVLPAGSVIKEILFRSQRPGTNPITYDLQTASNVTFASFEVPAGDVNFEAKTDIVIPLSSGAGSSTCTMKIRIRPFTGVRPRGISVTILSKVP